MQIDPVPGLSRFEDLLRECAPQVLGTLARTSADFGSAEDAVQEALLAAALHWPHDGIPDSPRGWLLQTARRKQIDQVRAERARQRREEEVERGHARLGSRTGDAEQDGGPAGDDRFDPDPDDSLTLLLLCCHPALTAASAVALTLRAVGGLSTAEVARAFLVPEATMAQRISRAKQQIRAAGARFELSGPAEETERLRSVRHVVYLIFNEGYAGSSGAELQRVELADEAIRLARMIRQRRPEDAESTGLLALMLLLHARRGARSSGSGELVPLPEQDRTRWDTAQIAEGLELLELAIAAGSVGEYQLQAAIAAEHDRAASAEATDWHRIHGLYELLERMTDNPAVILNRAVAASMVDGPAAGIAVLDRVEPPWSDHHRWWAVRAHLMERAGDPVGAVEHYRRAASRTTNLVEQRYLTAQAARLLRTT